MEDTKAYDKLMNYKKDASNIKICNPKNSQTQNTKNDQNETRDLARLIDYYRIVVENFEKERFDYLNRLEKLKIKNEDLHKVEWECKRRQEEIIELEQALYEASVALNNERKKVIMYTNEIENCKIRKKEDHRRIAQLLQLSEPIEQTIKLYEGRKPEKTEKYSNFNFENGVEEYIPNANSVSLKKALNTKKKKPLYSKKVNVFEETKEKSQKFIIPPSDEKQQILRTVMFPNEAKTEEINQENINLKREIEELKTKFDEQILKLEESRKLREEEFRQQCLNYNRETSALLEENQKLERLNYEVTKDLMILKYENGIKEKKVYEEMEVTKLNNKTIENNLKNVVEHAKKEKLYSQNEFNKKTREITECLRGQVRTQEENANIIKEQYQQIQKIYASKVKDLNDHFKILTDKCKILESRKNFNIEGYINEIDLMRKRLSSYRGYTEKLQCLSKKNKKMYEDELKNNQNNQNDLPENNAIHEREGEEEEMNNRNRLGNNA